MKPRTPEASDDCASCGEVPGNDCPEGKRPCGHHCNCSWTQDVCCWCGETFGEQKETDMKIEAIAKVCHEANRAYCQTIGDNSQPSWEDAPEWQRNSAIKGVEFTRDNPSAPPSASHDSWLEEKRVHGWKYGPIKDAEAKEHPCYVPYDQLPPEQRAKDSLFQGVARSLLAE